ncbi:hypothetical protein [Longimicrobium sp.]
MTPRFARLLLALSLACAACDDNMDDRKDGAEENTQQAAPADTAKAPGT